MYVEKTFINLATNASSINNNLALLHGNEVDVLASTLAVIQDGYVNVVPILNASKRSKYIPISHAERGSGVVKEVKWIEISKRIFFAVLSSNGVEIYDSEANNIIFQHGCRDTGEAASYCVGVCVLKGNILCVGTWLGTVWMFRHELETDEFVFINRVYAHDEAVLTLDGEGTYMASTSTDMSYFWTFRGRDFDIIRKLAVRGVMSIPTTLKYRFGFIFLGYTSGEYCIFDGNNEDLEIRVTAHKLKVTALDVSAKLVIVSSSDDCFVKLWQFKQEDAMVTLLQTIINEEGPVYGVGFLNFAATEFAVVTGGSTKVHIYINWEDSAADVADLTTTI